jgi:hypothetical protein
MSLYQLQPTTHEAFARLGQTRDRGCLVVFNAQEAFHVFVQGGYVVSVASAKKQGQPALDLALKLEGSSYGWIPGAEPTTKDIHVEIRDYLLDHSLGIDPAAGKTMRLPMPPSKTDGKIDFAYFFVPEDAPTVKIKVKKVTNVVGREVSCDITLENFQVSRRHCLLQLTDRGLLVKDLESTNGTFVNGIPLTDGYINDGNRLSLGTYVLTLYREKA